MVIVWLYTGDVLFVVAMISCARGGEMTRKSSAERKVEIIEAATKIIAIKGAKKFTAQEIADEIGMTAGGLFRHFGSMEEIVEAVLQNVEDVLFRDFPLSDEDPWQCLEAFFRQRVAIMVDNPNIYKILLSDHLTQLGDVQIAKRIQSLKAKTQRFIMQRLKDAHSAGQMAPDISVEAAGILIMGSVLAMGHRMTMQRDKCCIEKITSDVWQAIQRIRPIV